MFVPQRSYIRAGTLKAAIAYPREASVYSDSECAEVLRACGLGAYAGSLLDADRWSDRLSGGEQQHVAFARVLLARPSTIFLDECTSALDPQSEHHLYQLLIDRLPHATVLSVAHRKELLAFHQQTIDFRPSRKRRHGEAGRPGAVRVSGMTPRWRRDDAGGSVGQGPTKLVNRELK
ncbi:ATP-binding cassette domain-containing protein [Burkholderia glumae]|uniref:ATP-binding cassette domain-containing protein n=1 Tax=Burkholderia glumae TaxID=337 RepID=UPI00265DE5B9|nr:ATP-binding cassette domain-containing protein [Burkholderia glumae]